MAWPLPAVALAMLSLLLSAAFVDRAGARAACCHDQRRIERHGRRLMDQRYETLRVEDKGDGLVLLILNRPQVANAMNTQMGRDLLDFFDQINAEPLAYRCVVMTGAGDKAFCAGG